MRGDDGAEQRLTTDEARGQFFQSEVWPLLEENCAKCHGAKKRVKGDFNLMTREGLLRGGELGPAVTLSGAGKSTFLDAINYRDELEMPPKGKLPAEAIATLTSWVESGAPYADGSVEALQVTAEEHEQPSFEGAADYWAFQPITRPEPPAVENTDWVANAIDRFILRRLEEKSLAPAPTAGRIELLRRVTYDLTGLPPTPEEIDAFVADERPDAYERLVDRLLASKQYGVRWGRHWLDLVRFAETNSYERDGDKPNAWRYRDYVIDSFNADKPYDLFVLEQLAGDELPELTDDALTATAYYRLGIWDDEPTDRLQAKYDEYDDIVATTGQVFLGLTVNCARCHDHKVDPIAQSDYYSMLAFFHNIAPYAEGRGKRNAKLLTRALPSNPNEKTLNVGEKSPDAPETFVLIRGSAHAPGDKVEPRFPVVLGHAAPEIVPPEDGESSGRRLAFARWIVDPKNQLAARVIVNRIWQHHFGRGIVRSPNNFGGLGVPPTHPDLLDWLASELVAGGWRLKAMHRLILLSSSYRMSSRANEQALTVDPTNDLFWRFNMRRLSAEEIRDSILQVAGSLNKKMGGPGIYTKIPREVLAGQSRPGAGWGKSSQEERNRRSAYIFVKRSLLTPMIERFDAASTDTSCAVRFATTQATQVLTTLNGEWINEQARVFAARLRKETGDSVASQVRRGLRLVTGRRPEDNEVERGVALIEDLRQEHGASAEEALDQFALLLLNLNEFLYLD